MWPEGTLKFGGTVLSLLQKQKFSRVLSNASYRPQLIKTELPKTYRLQTLHEQLRCSFVAGPRQSVPTALYLFGVNLLFNRFPLLKERFREIPSVTMPLVPPEATRGMKILDRKAFKKTVDVPTVEVPVAHIGPLQKELRKCLFKMQGIKPVAELAPDRPGRDKFRIFLLDSDKFKTKEQFSADSKATIDEIGIDLSTWAIAQIELNYSNWHYDEILRAILPENSDGVAGFSVIGHILHLNLKDELLPYKEIIGEVLLDKIAKVETVVNKLNTIDNTFRNFSMEVLAGKADFITTAKENGLSFKMDFSKVYWNSRLSTEHQRIVDQLKSGDVLYDVFAGIGPFAVPAAKQKCVVLANDLNPESYKWLQVNMSENKVKTSPQMYNMDGREFIKTIVKADLERQWSEENYNNHSIHIVMNLPALAVEFLDAFVGLMEDRTPDHFVNVNLPQIHCYTFSNAGDVIADVRQRVTQTLMCDLNTNHTIRVVRNVAPKKEMLCVEFELQKDVLFPKLKRGGDEHLASEAEPPEKKSKTES